MSKNRTVTELTNKKQEAVYLFFRTQELCEKFFALAESEGFLFGDGIRPTLKETSDLIVIHSEKRMNYAGFAGRMAFGSGTHKAGEKNLVRVDFAKYLAGDEDYEYRAE